MLLLIWTLLTAAPKYPQCDKPCKVSPGICRTCYHKEAYLEKQRQQEAKSKAKKLPPKKK